MLTLALHFLRLFVGVQVFQYIKYLLSFVNALK